MVKFNKSELPQKIYKDVTTKLKLKIPTRHKWIRTHDGRLIRVRVGQRGGAAVLATWNGVTKNVDLEIGETIDALKTKLADNFNINEAVIKTLPLKIIINGKIMKDNEPIDKIPKKITILGSKPKIEEITPPANTTPSADLAPPASDTVSTVPMDHTAENSTDLKEDFIDDTEKYLVDIIRPLFNDLVKRLSDVKTILSKLNDSNTDTFIHDNSKFRVDKGTFNLPVKIICVDRVIEFLKLIVDKIGNDVVGNDVITDERRNLAEIIANNIVIKELEFNIYNVFVNTPYGDTLIVPKPNNPEYMCGIPTSGLIEDCVKLLSYLDGIPDFPKIFFKPIDDEIDKLNENTGTTGTTGKTYTRYTIFSDTDSQPITASSLQKRNIQTPFHIFLLDTLKNELEKYRKLGSIDNDNYKGLVNDINRLLSTESPQMERYELYNEISKMLARSSVIINYYDLLLMIVSCYIDDANTAVSIRNKLFGLIGIHGTYIFDIKIIEAFIDGLDVNDSMGSIIYKGGYDNIDTLINVKQYIDGYVIDALNDYGFSLKEIGDFMNNLISEVKEQYLTFDYNLDNHITASLEPIIQQLEQREQIQQRLDTDPLGLKQEATSFNQQRTLVSPVLGGNNKHRSKHNANYRKKYKKFVNKYIVKKKRNKNKYNTKKSNKNKTRKNKKSKRTKSKRINKTVKKTKHRSSNKSKFNSNHKSKHNKKHNKKVNTNYYNHYKHSKTHKH